MTAMNTAPRFNYMENFVNEMERIGWELCDALYNEECPESVRKSIVGVFLSLEDAFAELHSVADVVGDRSWTSQLERLWEAHYRWDEIVMNKIDPNAKAPSRPISNQPSDEYGLRSKLDLLHELKQRKMGDN